MAEYTNLTSLEGLEAGDVVTYSNSGTNFWNLDTAGKRLQIDVLASSFYGDSHYEYGGITTAVFNSKNFKEITIYTRVRSAGIAIGTFSDYDSLLYYRILVAGAPGTFRYGSNTSGGGLQGYPTSGNLTGGTQTEGGTAKMSGYTCVSGSFGYGGVDSSWEYGSTYYGGFGWYGGGFYQNGSNFCCGGGGSGFVIGKSTTTYPDGYFDDDTSTISKLEKTIEDGASTETNTVVVSKPSIILTILEDISEDTETSSQSVLSYFNGTEFVDTNAKYYDGSSFIDCDVYRYNGTEFEKI